jgi:N-acetylmuramic acid 6-phosphate etherase
MPTYEELIALWGELATEQVNPRTTDIDKLDAHEIVLRINDEDQTVAAAVRKASDTIAHAANLYAAALRNGGRIFYVGAGTSGRLGVLDAAECPPTFGTDPDQIIGLISGGYDTLVLSQEGVEDDRMAARHDLQSRQLTSDDLVIGIAASSRTPYTLEALRFASGKGARTVFISCNRPSAASEASQLIASLDCAIILEVGPEAITGSTRMKSGTAQKMTLNLISTTAMVLTGKTYGNLMVDLKATSEKLAARSRKLLIDFLQIDLKTVDHLLVEANGSVKTAIVMHKKKVDRQGAETALERASGHLSEIID